MELDHLLTVIQIIGVVVGVTIFVLRIESLGRKAIQTAETTGERVSYQVSELKNAILDLKVVISQVRDDHLNLKERVIIMEATYKNGNRNVG